MRIFQMLCRSRRPQNPNKVPLAKPRLYLALRDRVCTKKDRVALAPALQEMQNLITKLAKNDYNSQFCQKEIIEMRDANTASYEQYLKEKRENRMGKLSAENHLKNAVFLLHLNTFYNSNQNQFDNDFIKTNLILKSSPLHRFRI